MTRSPYKLLDYYRFEDAGLFFGREEETRRMIGEILSSRLLVLFSPSGSGKTSLINAGVRPELENMGYQTIYTRMEDAPIPAVCQAVSEKLKLPPCPDKEKQDLYEFLKKAAQTAGKPLVIFLDQFEEFFIVFRNQQEMRQEFIQQAARIKYDDQLPVFLVFSLREDYFAHLHEFREAIPSIFQNNANIRLKAFNEKAARRVIEKPLQNKDIQEGKWRFEKQLVDSIIKDLKTDQGIEPIKLQMVCHFLWSQRPKETNEIPLSIYQACGGVEAITNNFINERLKKVPRVAHKLMVRVFEALKTPDNTKRFRSFEDLQSQFLIKKPHRLKTLFKQLVKLDMVREEERSGTSWYEFKHDYLAAEINDWIKERKEKNYRRRFWYGVLPGIILFLSLFTYLFISYNTFYAEFSKPQYEEQQEEIVITRGFNPFNEYITTGYFKDDLNGFPAIKQLRNRLKLSFWDKNNWKALAETLRIVERGKFLYQIGETELGIDTLSRALKDKDLLIQLQAISSLRSLGKGDKKIIDALMTALKDGPSSVRFEAVDSLVRLGKVDKNVIDTLMAALKDEDSYIRVRAADTLVRLGKVEKNIIDTLMAALKDDNSNVRFEAADSLVRLGKVDKNVIDALKAAMKDESSFVRVQAADSLVQLGKVDKNVIDALKAAMRDDIISVQLQAADSLGSLGQVDKNVIDALLAAFKNINPHLRVEVAKSLVRLGHWDKNVIDAFMAALKDGYSNVRVQAADSLIRLGHVDKNVTDVLTSALKDEDSYARVQAAESLGNLWKDKSDAELIEFLKHPLSEKRTIAAYALAQKKTVSKETLDEIKNLKDKDKRPWVRLGAWKAYELIVFGDLGE